MELMKEESLEREQKGASTLPEDGSQQAYCPFRGGDSSWPEEEGPDLLELWLVLWNQRKFLLALFLVATISTGCLSLFVFPKIYQAKASLIPVESREGGLSSYLSMLGGIGLSLPAGKAAPSQTLVAILESRTLKEKVISRLDLLKIFSEKEWDPLRKEWKDPTKAPSLEDGVKALRGITRVSDERRTGLVTITVEWKDPALASEIANAHILELEGFINANALSVAKKKRLFLEAQVSKTKRELSEAEERFKDFQQEKRFVAMNEQAEAAIRGLAELKGMVAAKEVELDVIRTYATSLNPKVQLLESQLTELRKQLERLEANHSKEGGSKLSLAGAPELGLTYGRLKRDVVFHEKVLELLTQQYELARIEESKEDVAFQVIDWAVPPVKKYKPKTRTNVLLAGVLSILLGTTLVFGYRYVRRVRQDLRAKLKGS
jgi:tyrosine-protein kinase Etk/Wzc